MNLVTVRLRCGMVAEGITLPDPFDLAGFLTALGADRGRPIVVVDYPLRSEGLTGLVVALDDVDYVVVTDRAGAGWQRLQIVLHEVAHLLLGHTGPADDDLRRMFPAFGPELVRRSILRRGHGYPSVAEQEAEVLATLLLHRVRRATRSRRRLAARLRPVREAGTYLRLYPLWRLLYDTVDGIALEAAPRSRLADLASLRDLGFRLQRRLIEIGDGLLRLGPYMTASGVDCDVITATARRPRPVILEAARIRRAALAASAGPARADADRAGADRAGPAEAAPAERSGAAAPAWNPLRDTAPFLVQVSRALREVTVVAGDNVVAGASRRPRVG